MSGAQLARRMNVSRALISKTEKAELEGGVTIKTMQNMAQSMNCRFIYAIVPEHSIEDIIAKRAYAKAKAQVTAVSIHMALENQTLQNEQLNMQINSLAQALIENPSSHLWNDE